MSGPHHRSIASCTCSRCSPFRYERQDDVAAGEDVNDSSRSLLHGPGVGGVRALEKRLWEMMAAASTSHAITPTSPQVFVG